MIIFVKKVYSEIDIVDNVVSVFYVVVELVKKVFGKLKSKYVVVIGVGEMGELLFLNFLGFGILNVIIVNWILFKVKILVEKYNVLYDLFLVLLFLLEIMDIVISFISVEDYIIINFMVKIILEIRKLDLLVLIDIVVLWDIELGIDVIINIFNYDVDDLKDLVDVNLREC